MFLRNLLFIFLFLLSLSSAAKTLQFLAQKSNVLLVAADDAEIQKKCKINSEQISRLSQKLKAAVDEKISQLTEADFLILDRRKNSCQKDCTCSVFSLAFESQNKKNEIILEKATHETAADRLKCATQIKNICKLLK